MMTMTVKMMEDLISTLNMMMIKMVRVMVMTTTTTNFLQMNKESS